jgi:pimeloyl-ACP methyl ester carboxylesterase
VVDDLIAILDEIGYEQAVLIGHSMGGVIAQEVVFRHPERVTALGMIGSVCITFPVTPFDMGMMLLTTATVYFYPLFWQRLIIANATSLTAQARSYTYNTIRRLPHNTLMGIWAALALCFHYEPGYRIEQPLLLTHGQLDTWGNVQLVAPLWAFRDPQSHYVIVPMAGHNANQDNPAFFNATLLDFLQKHVSVAANPAAA